MSIRSFCILVLLLYSFAAAALETDLKLDTTVELPTDLVVEAVPLDEMQDVEEDIWNWDTYLCQSTDELWLDLANTPEYGPIFGKLFTQIPQWNELWETVRNRDNMAIAFMRVLDKPEAFSRFVTCDLDPLAISPQQYDAIYRNYVMEALVAGTLTKITPEQLIGLTALINGIK